MVNYPGVIEVWAVPNETLPEHIAEAAMADYAVAGAYIEKMDKENIRLIGEGRLTDKATSGCGIPSHEVELVFRSKRGMIIGFHPCFIARFANGRRVLVGTHEATPEVIIEGKSGEKDGDPACFEWTVKFSGPVGAVAVS